MISKTLVLWSVAVLTHLSWHLFEVDGRPPTAEVYTQLVWFQVAAFAFTKLPYWLGGLLIVLLGEFVAMGRARREG